jgi:hypothetical protein
MPEINYASKGVAGAGLGLGIAGTALGLLCNGGLGGLFSGGGACHENTMVNRYELGQEQKIAELQSQIALRDANTYNDQKMLEVYKYVDGKFSEVERELCEQRVYNATNTSTLSCLANQVAQLMSLTKVVIPNTSICPGWGNVTVAPATTTAA